MFTFRHKCICASSDCGDLHMFSHIYHKCTASPLREHAVCEYVDDCLD